MKENFKGYSEAKEIMDQIHNKYGNKYSIEFRSDIESDEETFIVVKNSFIYKLLLSKECSPFCDLDGVNLEIQFSGEFNKNFATIYFRNIKSAAYALKTYLEEEEKMKLNKKPYKRKWQKVL
ncbi:MAG: hypothetical protein ACOCV1_06615 [Bacillota bacterium]